MVSFGWVREPEPASWLEGYTLPENPTLGQKLRGFEPVYPWDRPRPIPSETMISIKSLHPTADALRFARRSVSPAAAAGEFYRSATGRSATTRRATAASASAATSERGPHERSLDAVGRHVQRPLRPPARVVRRQARVGGRPRRLGRPQHRRRDGGRPVGRLGRRGPHGAVG